MEVKMIKVLLVEDSPSDALIVESELTRGDGAKFCVVHLEQLNAALDRLRAQHFDVVLLDLNLPDSQGFETFLRLYGEASEVPIVVLSGQNDEELALKAVQAGAQDFLVKGQIGEEVLQRSIRYAIERQRADRKLAESKERYRLLIERSPDAYLVQCDGQVVFANAASLKLFGVNHRDQLLGRSFLTTVSPEFHEIICKQGQNGHANGSNLPIEVLGARLDGTVLAVQGTSNPFIHEGRPAVQVVLHDITEQRRAEAATLAGEAQIREQAKLLDLAHDAIMVRDMEDRVEYWNQGAEKLYGWNAAEVQGKEASSFLHERNPAAFAAARATVIENGKWTGECKHTSKEGDAVMVCSRWTLVRDEMGKPKAILIIDTDVTEQKRAEEQFLRAQRLEGIGTLASGVAHDLNNILAPILMGAAVLRRTEMPEADEMILSTIETCAQRGAHIVKQVLTFARGAEGARLLLQPAHLIDDMAKIAQGTFPKTIRVRIDYVQSLWPIEGDPTQLHQVLLNLSVNARDAMPAGGALTISAKNFPVDEHYASMTPGAKAGPHVLFEVKDTGMGIARQIIDKIFDPFFTTKELGRGTGLGLSTVIGIVKSHGGFLSVHSEIGRGTTFKVFLPAKVGELAGVEQSVTPALPPANGELLLIVDDEKPILQVAQALLEGHGYQVLTAGDAPEALAIFALRKDEIKLVLTDLAMPLMDGIALIRTLQKMKPDVCVVASTGQGSPEQLSHDLPGLNVRACLTKPYNKEMLLTTLRDTLSPQTNKP